MPLNDRRTATELLQPTRRIGRPRKPDAPKSRAGRPRIITLNLPNQLTINSVPYGPGQVRVPEYLARDLAEMVQRMDDSEAILNRHRAGLIRPGQSLLRVQPHLLDDIMGRSMPGVVQSFA